MQSSLRRPVGASASSRSPHPKFLKRVKTRRFVDTVTVHVLAGKGGNGCVSFRRERHVPKGGPDGGDGGRGGNVTLRADRNIDSLLSLFYAPDQRAEDGGHGKGKRQHGRNGADLCVGTPCGTEVWDADSGELIHDLVEHGDELLVGQGGDGGKGNCHWLTSRHRAPMEHTDGTVCDVRDIKLVLKTVADVGFVGYPNAGKSSLLAAVSDAHPKIAAYPFTTLHPVVGTVRFEDYTSLRVVDVPGLIDGAHEGVGLGHAFLRHIERAATLVFVIDMAGVDGRCPADDYMSLRRELEQHKADMLSRPSLLLANKMDVETAEKNFAEFVRRTKKTPFRISVATGDGVEDLKNELRKVPLG